MTNPTVPASMRAAVLRGPGALALERVDVPRPGPGEMLVRIRACGICGSDLMEWYVEQKAPFVFGHEPAGDVVAVGPGVTGFQPGDRVVLHHHAPCMECDVCRRGDFVHCPVWRKQALLPGGMAEYAVVAKQSVRHDTHLLPAHVSYEAGTLVEPLACVVKALNRAGFAPGMRVLVIGLGFTGQLFGFLARRRGAAFVAGSDTAPARLDLARKHWADEVYDVGRPLPDETSSPDTAAPTRETTSASATRSPVPDHSFDLVVVTPGSPAAMLTGVSAVRNGGALLLFAPTAPGEAVPFPVHELFFREVNIVTSYSAGPDDMKAALQHVHAGDVPADVLISHRFRLEHVAEAYKAAQDVHKALKVVVTMD